MPDYDQRDAMACRARGSLFTIDGDAARSSRLPHSRAVFAALKSTEKHHGDAIFSSGHVVGTYRMGSDPKTSVVNPDQRAHDHPNLYLLGSGVFPTSAASNPTLTIAALALRAVDAIRRSIGD